MLLDVSIEKRGCWLMYRERMLFGGRFPGNLEPEVFKYKYATYAHPRITNQPRPAHAVFSQLSHIDSE